MCINFIYLFGDLLYNYSTINLAFIAVGKIAGAVGSNIGPYLDTILGFIKEGLNVKGYALLFLFYLFIYFFISFSSSL